MIEAKWIKRMMQSFYLGVTFGRFVGRHHNLPIMDQYPLNVLFIIQWLAGMLTGIGITVFIFSVSGVVP